MQALSFFQDRIPLAMVEDLREDDTWTRDPGAFVGISPAFADIFREDEDEDEDEE